MRRAVAFKPVMGVILVMALIAVAAAAFAQQRGPGAGGGPGGGRGAMAGMMSVERTWAQLAFEVNISNQQMATLRPTFQSAWKTRNDAIAKAREKGDMSGLEAVGKKIEASIEAKLKTVLTKEQMAKWQKMKQEAAARRQAGPRGPGGGGQR